MISEYCYSGPNPWEYHEYRLIVKSKKFKHTFTIMETCSKFARMKAIDKFRAKHPGATKIEVIERV